MISKRKEKRVFMDLSGSYSTPLVAKKEIVPAILLPLASESLIFQQNINEH
jgi:hypothetical protein